MALAAAAAVVVAAAVGLATSQTASSLQAKHHSCGLQLQRPCWPVRATVGIGLVVGIELVVGSVVVVAVGFAAAMC